MMSMTGFALMEGMEVLPTCSIEMMGVLARAWCKCSLSSRNCVFHDGLYFSMMTSMAESVPVISRGSVHGSLVCLNAYSAMRSKRANCVLELIVG